MNFKNILAVPDHPTFTDVSLLLMRFVAGLAFMFHGWGKIQNPFGWMGPDAFAPSVFQALAAVAEFGGGLALMIGLATPLASFGIACTMAVAASMHALVWRDPFVGRDGSYELAAVYLCLAILFIATGPGRFSLDSLFFGRRRTID